MYQVAHGLSGVLIGSQINNPIIAFILGVASHFILDAIPHDSIEIYHYNQKGGQTKKMALQTGCDLFFLLLIVSVLRYTGGLKINLPLTAGIIGALLPDYIWGFAELFKIKSVLLDRYKQLHLWSHKIFYKKIYLPLKYTVLIQLTLTVLLVVLYLLL